MSQSLENRFLSYKVWKTGFYVTESRKQVSLLKNLENWFL